MGLAGVVRLLRRPVLVDLALCAVTTATVLLTMTVVREEGARPVMPYGYLFGVAIAAPVLLRRSRPGVALVLSAAALMAYYSLDFPGFSPFLALAVQLYAAAVTGHLGTGAVVAAWVTIGGAFSRLSGPDDVAGTLPGLLTEVALIVGSLLLGDAVRARRMLRRQMADGLRRAVREAARESERRAMADRLGVARDLHDVLAHTVALIGVQANVAAELFEADPPRARQAVDTIRTSCREALADLGNTIRLLRIGAADGAVHGLADVPALIEQTSQAGVEVRYTVSGDPVPLRPSADLTAYRVIQESLTNVLRHARASTVDVDIVYSPFTVDIRVVDDGVGLAGTGAHRTGHGLTGMRERVTALRGDFTAEEQRTGGYAVMVRIPVGR